jgi:hypothetical protein
VLPVDAVPTALLWQSRKKPCRILRWAGSNLPLIVK